MSRSSRRKRPSQVSAAYQAGRERSAQRAREDGDAPIAERVLAFTSLGLIALSVLSYLATILAAVFTNRQVLTESVWPVVVWFSYVGLPVGFVLLITLLVLNMRRRSRAQRSSRHRR